MKSLSLFRKQLSLLVIFSLVALPSLFAQVRQIVFLQINDTYEITPLSGVGGMARMATLHKQILKENPHTLFVHAGDFVNPSVLSALSYQGKRIRGKQMVEVLNTIGLDYTAFGNHEFDINEADLQERLNESKFAWIAANVFHKTKQGEIPFARTGQTPFRTSLVRNLGGLRVGIIGVTIPLEKDYVRCADPLAAAEVEYNRIKDSCDFVVAITHQSIEADRELAQRLPNLKLIMGGHEHDNTAQKVGNTLIYKADANVKTAYIHRVSFDATTKQFSSVSELKKIDASIPDDEATTQIVNKWQAIANQGIKELGFDASEKLMEAKPNEPLDGLEASVRNKHTNLTDIVVKAMLDACPEADAAIVNGGSIRIDDRIAGTVTAYDLMRILPFGGGLVEVEMKGSLLVKMLEAGEKNKGKGGFLHYEKITHKPSKNRWKIKGKKIKPEKYYRIVTSDFLITGKESNMEWFVESNADIRKVHKANPQDIKDLRTDARKAIAVYMRKQK